MRVIITGGTGLIGRALIPELTTAGHEVLVLSRNPGAHALPGAQIIAWDARSPHGWAGRIDAQTAIVNLAGESIAGENPLRMRWTRERKRRILESRVNAGKAVVAAVQAAPEKPAVVIQASAVGYYGPRAESRVDEETPPGDDFLSRVCLAWEASTAPVEELGVRRAIVRTGIVLSPAGGAFPLQMLPFKLFAGGPLGSGRQGYPWIHLSDEAAAIRFLLENPEAHGVFNLTAPHPVSNAEFARLLGKVMRRPSWLPAPAFTFKLAFGEAATILLDGQMAVPERLLELGFNFKFSHLEDALQDLLAVEH